MALAHKNSMGLFAGHECFAPFYSNGIGTATAPLESNCLRVRRPVAVLCTILLKWHWHRRTGQPVPAEIPCFEPFYSNGIGTGSCDNSTTIACVLCTILLKWHWHSWSGCLGRSSFHVLCTILLKWHWHRKESGATVLVLVLCAILLKWHWHGNQLPWLVLCAILLKWHWHAVSGCSSLS